MGEKNSKEGTPTDEKKVEVASKNIKDKIEKSKKKAQKLAEEKKKKNASFEKVRAPPEP